jgi:hypothetical protein
MKESWEEQLRQRLEGHEMAPPEGLWEDVCKELGMTPFPVLTPSTRSSNKRWYYIAAAVLLALAGFFAIYQFNNDIETKALAVESNQSPPEQSDAPASEVPKEDNLITCQTPCEPKNCQTASEPESASELEPPCEPEPLVEPENVLSKEDLQRPESEEPIPESHVSEPQAKRPVEDRGIDQLPPSESLPKRNETPDRWSLGLTASGGLIAANNSVSTDRQVISNLSIPKEEYEADNSSLGVTYAQTEIVWKHRLPVRFGLGVQYRLNDQLSLLSGISYTYLYSECSTSLYRNISYHQKLHYLGVPLGIAWQLWSSGQFRINLSGSAMLEKCISASFDNKRSDDIYGKKPWQWSLNAAAGVEYSFTPQLGVYLEPSLGYYFDDGTQLEHYYKEHPLAPSINFGLRFNINK